MNKDEIIALWKSVGWNTLKDYHDYLKFSESRIILDALDPDKINPKEFWKASDEHFSTDPVCNHNNFSDEILSTEESNKYNYLIPLYSGMIGQTEFVITDLKKVMGCVSVAEIGSGYGSFYENFISKHPNISYKGFDIIPRASYVEEIEGDDGCFSDAQVLKYQQKYNLFFSSNTFQHLSKKQVEKYLIQVYDMLPYGGYFNMMYANAETSYHYGQAIELIDIYNLQDFVKHLGFSVIGSASIRIPNSLTPFSLILKK